VTAALRLDRDYWKGRAQDAFGRLMAITAELPPLDPEVAVEVTLAQRVRDFSLRLAELERIEREVCRIFVWDEERQTVEQAQYEGESDLSPEAWPAITAATRRAVQAEGA
jgi:hypothetical protein